MSREISLRGTTVLSIRHKGMTVMIGDGQVTEGSTVLKGTAKKVRKLYHDRVIAGFAGATADAFTLFERFEKQLEKYSGDLVRASVELAKDWRLDRNLRRLEAMLLVANKDKQLLLTGVGDVIEPDEGVAAIGSGGVFARAAALALVRHSNLNALEVGKQAMGIAAQLCIYTNNQFETHVLES